jgi:hypothetical protein
MPPGWFPDPLGRYDHRYFNGTSWTSDVSSDGERYVDPLGVGPGSTPGMANTNKAATTAVIMGSVGLALAWIPFIGVIGLVLAVLGLVFGTKGLRRSRELGVGRTASIAGIVMGSLGVAAAIAGIALSVMVWREVVQYVEPGPVITEVTECTIDGRRVDTEGTLENRDDQARSYTLFVTVDDRRESVIIDDVAAGETVKWAIVITARSSQLSASECDPTLTVNGPFPYGLEIDPIEN